MAANSLALSLSTIDEAYMPVGRLHYFQAKLLRWRGELSLRLQGSLEEGAAESLPDWVDSAALTTQAELSWADRDRAVQTLRQIDAALARIDAGTYGYCAETGEEIGLERLMAMPIALFSVETQRERERRRQMRR